MIKRHANLKLWRNGQYHRPPSGIRVLFSQFRESFVIWWHGGRPLSPSIVAGEWAEAYLAMRASLRRTWVYSALFGILIMLSTQWVFADPYWPFFVILLTLLWFVLPRLEEPALFLWYGSVLGWLILYNIAVQFLPLPILARIFWAAMVIFQGYGIYQMVRGYRQFRVFYTLRDPRNRKPVVTRHLGWGWIVSVGMTLLALGLLAIAVKVEGVSSLASYVVVYLTAIAPAFALASLGVLGVHKRLAIGGATISVAIALGLCVFSLYTTLGV